MNPLWLLILALSFSPAKAGWQDYVPNGSALDRVQGWILNHTDERVHFFLYEHLPKLFPVPFLCQSQKDGKAATIVPQAPPFSAEAGAKFSCPGLLELRVIAPTKIAIYRRDLKYGLALQGGSVDLQPLRTGFNVSVDDNEFEIAQASARQPLKIRGAGADSLAYIEAGTLEVKLSPPAGEKKLFWGTHLGRIAARAPFFSGVRYIFPGDIIASADLSVFRNQLTGIDPAGVWQKFGLTEKAETGFKAQIYREIQAGSSVPASPDLLILAMAGPQKCQLLTRKTESSEYVKAYEFSPTFTPHPLRLKLHPDYLKFFLNLACTDEHGQTVFSNELPPPQK